MLMRDKFPSHISKESMLGSHKVNCYTCKKQGKNVPSEWCVRDIDVDKYGKQIGIIAKYYCDKHMRQENPIQSPEQYGLMQAVASGIAKVKGVSKQVAKKLIHETPKGLRSEFASVEAEKRSNPDFAGKSAAFIAGYKWTIAKRKTAKGSFNTQPGALAYLKKIGLEGTKDLGYQGNASVRERVALANQVYNDFIDGGSQAWDDLIYEQKHKYENPETAEGLTKKFHGREPKETIEITESESYDSDLAMLGELTELEILSEDAEDVIPISFSHDTDTPEDTIRLCSTPNGRQLEFVGGDQSLDLEEFEEAGLQLETGKRNVVIGPIHSISYYTDKHHLAGSSNQKTGVEFIHEFSEESNGALPMLVYDTKDERMEIVGGRYKVEEEGIKD